MSGSLREQSYNRQLLAAAGAGLPPKVSLEIFQGLRSIPAFDEDQATTPSVRALRNALGEADAVLIATPEYNGSIPGQLKNALDWASRPFPNNVLRDKPVLVIGASTGLFGAVWAQAELRKVLGRIGARVIDQELPVGRAHEAFQPDGSLRDPDLAAALKDQVGRLLAAAQSLQERSA